jgi:hypothetical protein
MQMEPPMSTASQTEARYFIFAKSGRAIVSVERDTNEMDLISTVKDLIDGQIDKPSSIFCAEDNRFFDVTEDVARLVADRAAAQGLDLPQAILEFVSEHCGLRVAYALGLEAA